MTEQDLKECIAEVKHSAIPEQSKEKIINTLQDTDGFHVVRGNRNHLKMRL